MRLNLPNRVQSTITHCECMTLMLRQSTICQPKHKRFYGVASRLSQLGGGKCRLPWKQKRGTFSGGGGVFPRSA